MFGRKIGLTLAVLASMVPVCAHSKGAGVGTIFGALIGSAVGKAAGSSMSIEEALVRASDYANKQLPRTEDVDTRWDSTSAGPGRRFTYHYTFTRYRAADLDTGYVFREMTSILRNHVCSTDEMQVFLRNNVTIEYSYRGKDGGFVTSVKVVPRDCGLGS